MSLLNRRTTRSTEAAVARSTLHNHSNPAAAVTATVRPWSYNPSMLYSYRTLEYKGTIELRESTVVSTMRYRGNRWERETPYSDISPYPTKTEATSSSIWSAGIIGIVAVLGGGLGFSDGSLSTWYTFGLLVSGIAMIIFAWSFRRETWIAYSTATRGNRIAFSRNGPNSTEFQSFCDELNRRILSSKPENGRTKD